MNLSTLDLNAALPGAGGKITGVAENPESDLERGVQFKIDGEYDQAVIELQKVLAAVPDHPRAHLELGLVYGFTGMFDESLVELQEAVRLEPANLRFHEKLGLTCTMLGMYDEAREQFELIIAQGSNVPDVPEVDEARKQLRFFQEFGV
ncbi:MAG: tetratricopeptide repeat protein [Armatimonadota bacterium]|nr:tetratricopeptide repeat protein [Armatimonadota bacterium]